MKQLIKTLLGLIYYNTMRRFQIHDGHRILIYHAFGSRLKHDSYGISIPLAKFEAHVTQVLQHRKVVQLDKTILSASGNPGPTLSITMDDGYKDNIEAAAILSRLRIPFSIFVVTDQIGSEDYLSQTDLRTLAKDPYCQIGSHTRSHPRLAQLSLQDQRKEIFESREILQDILGIPVKGLAYPYGSYNRQSQDLAREAGYEFALSSDIGLNLHGRMNQYAMKRSEILAHDSVAELSRKILGYYDFFAIRNSQ